MIRSFRHKGVERFFRTGSEAGMDGDAELLDYQDYH
jgi:hypothetical protein